MSNNKKFTLDKSGKNSNNSTLAKSEKNSKKSGKNLELIEQLSQLKNYNRDDGYGSDFDRDDGYGTDGDSDDEDSKNVSRVNKNKDEKYGKYNIISDDTTDNENSSDSSGSNNEKTKPSMDNKKMMNSYLKSLTYLKNECDTIRTDLSQYTTKILQLEQQQKEESNSQDDKSNSEISKKVDGLTDSVNTITEHLTTMNENYYKATEALLAKITGLEKTTKSEAKHVTEEVLKVHEEVQGVAKNVENIKTSMDTIKEDFKQSEGNFMRNWKYLKEKCWDIFWTEEEGAFAEKIRETQEKQQQAKDDAEKFNQEAANLNKKSDDKFNEFKDLNKNPQNNIRRFDNNDIIQDLWKMHKEKISIRTINFEELILKSYFDDKKLINFNMIILAFSMRTISEDIFIAFVESLISIYDKYEELKKIDKIELHVDDEGDINPNKPFLKIFTRFKFVYEYNINGMSKRVVNNCLKDLSEIVKQTFYNRFLGKVLDELWVKRQKSKVKLPIELVDLMMEKVVDTLNSEWWDPEGPAAPKSADYYISNFNSRNEPYDEERKLFTHPHPNHPGFHIDMEDDEKIHRIKNGYKLIIKSIMDKYNYYHFFEVDEDDFDFRGGAGTDRVIHDCITKQIALHKINRMLVNILSIDQESTVNVEEEEDYWFCEREECDTKYFKNKDIETVVQDHANSLSILGKKNWKEFISMLLALPKIEDKLDQALEKLKKIFDVLYEYYNFEEIALHTKGMAMLNANKKAREDEDEDEDEVEVEDKDEDKDEADLSNFDMSNWKSYDEEDENFSLTYEFTPEIVQIVTVNNSINQEFEAFYNYFNSQSSVNAGKIILNTGACLTALIYFSIAILQYGAELWYNFMRWFMANSFLFPFPINFILASILVSLYIGVSGFLYIIFFNQMGITFGYGGTLGNDMWHALQGLYFKLYNTTLMVLEFIFNWIMSLEAVKNAIDGTGIIEFYQTIKGYFIYFFGVLGTLLMNIQSIGSYLNPSAWWSGGGNTTNNAIILNKNSNQPISTAFVSNILTDYMKVNDKVTQMMTNITNISGATPELKNMVSTAISTQVSINSALFESVNFHISILKNKTMRDYVLEGIGNDPNRLLLLYKTTALLNIDTDKIDSVPLSKLLFVSHRKKLSSFLLGNNIKYENPSKNKKQIQNKKSNKGGRLCKSKKNLKKLCTRSKKGKKKKGGKVTKKRLQKGKSRRKYT